MAENITNSFYELSADTTTNNCTAVPALSNVFVNGFGTMNIFNIVNYIISIFGFLVNIFTIAIICLYKPMHKYFTNILIVNQSLVDTVAAAVLLFSTIYPYTSAPKLVPGFLADEALCRLWISQAPLYGILISSTYGIVAVTLERFLAVVFPLWHKARLSRGMIAIMIGIVWMIGPTFFFPLAITTSRITSDGICNTLGYYKSNELQRAVSAFSFFVNLFCHCVVNFASTA